MATTFMTNEQWAQIKGFSKFLTDTGAGYVDKNDYPTAAGLDLLRSMAHAELTKWIPGSPDATTYEFQLLGLEYSIVELMVDDEQGRETQEGRPLFIPRDYLTPMQQRLLSGYGTSWNRGVGS